MRVGVVLMALMMIGVASCKKATHRRIASKDEGTIWTIDEMVYTATEDGTILHDTLLFESGRFEFRVEKSRYQHGLGAVYRREYILGAWSIETEQQFSWSSEEDDIEIIYEDGLTESIKIEESKRNAQHWLSTVTHGTTTYNRIYFLSRSFDD
jgi:hypothetical protein